MGDLMNQAHELFCVGGFERERVPTLTGEGAGEDADRGEVEGDIGDE